MELTLGEINTLLDLIDSKINNMTEDHFHMDGTPRSGYAKLLDRIYGKLESVVFELQADKDRWADNGGAL